MSSEECERVDDAPHAGQKAGLDAGVSKPKLIRCVPAEFNLSLYDAAEGFGAKAWAEQLAKRVLIENGFRTGDSGCVDQLMPTLLANPLQPFTYDRRIQSSIQQSSLPSYANRSIRGLSVADLNRCAGLAASNCCPSDKAFDECVRADPSLSSLAPFGHLLVDLTATDGVILEDFKRWLAGHREGSNVEAVAFHRNSLAEEMKQWHACKALAYFDLKAWGRWKGLRISEQAMADVLFPNAPATERLRASKRAVDQIFTFKTVDALLASGH